MRTMVRLMGQRPLAALALAAVQAAAQGSAWNAAHYHKREVLVPMRDGQRLFTAIYTPAGAKGPLPILMERTPYGSGPYGPEAFPDELGPSEAFAREGFIFVHQDVRGRMMSEGVFTDLTPCLDGAPGVDEATDTWDTVAWLLDHVEGHNGRVGQWGISYPAFYAAAAMPRAHPAMVAVSPQAPIADWFEGDDFHHNGALWLPHLFNFIVNFGRPRPEPTPSWPAPFDHGTTDGYAFFLGMGPLSQANARYLKDGIPFWNEVMAHGTRDAYWKARDLRPHIRDVRPAVLTVGGWFDAENLFGSLQVDRALERRSPATERHLVMGPWSHGGWARTPGDRLGDIPFGSATSRHFQARFEFPFFMHHLKGAADPGLPRAAVFQTGANRWLAFDRWPPAGTQPTEVWLQAGGHLGFEPARAAGAVAWTSDPAKPVPYREGAAIGMVADYMTADQRFASRRPDVATWTSPPLERDMAVAGPLRADLFVSTTGTDADWVVKIIDVWPAGEGPGGRRELGGYQQLLRGDVMRGKFRQSLERPEPFVPGRPAEVAFTLNDVCHTFLKGHRIMVQVQGSWFPLVDRNPQVFTDIYKAGASDFRKARLKVHVGPGLPSRIVLPVLP